MYSFAEVLPDERPAPQTQAQAQAQTQPVNAGPAPRRNETPSAGSSTQTQRQQKRWWRVDRVADGLTDGKLLANLFGGKGDPYEAGMYGRCYTHEQYLLVVLYRGNRVPSFEGRAGRR